jgi:diadenylate cyclase
MLLGAPRDDGALALQELATVLPSLAARRIGALIVVERGTGLRQYAELGVPLDAVVSADLIESVFLPHSPLHDGAVFIQGSRVVAAGCFLPLSRNLEVARAYGTRHRAALGISEETDAVALVVSEESGRMSIAVEGQIETVGDGETLRRRLDELVGGRAAQQPSAFRASVRRLLARANDQG